MNLPPLPDTSWVDIPHFTYTSKDMLAYGKACAAAALEDAVAIVLNADKHGCACSDKEALAELVRTLKEDA